MRGGSIRYKASSGQGTLDSGAPELLPSPSSLCLWHSRLIIQERKAG